MLDAETMQRLRQRRGMFEVDCCAERCLELASIRLEDRGSTIEEEVAVLRVDDDRDTTLPRGTKGLLDHARHEHTLVVILENERVRVPNGAIDGVQKTIDLDAFEVGVLLFVHAYHLLSASDDPCLGRRRTLDLDECVIATVA